MRNGCCLDKHRPISMRNEWVMLKKRQQVWKKTGWGQPRTVVSWVGSLGEKRQERNFQPGVSVEKIRMVFHPLFLRMLG